MVTSTSESPITDDRVRPRLHRSASDKICCGVCGGLADYMAVDPSLVRVAFVVATLWGGIGLLLYIVLAIILPLDDDERTASSISGERSRMVAGLVLVVLGGLVLAGNMGLTPWLSWNLFWPSLLILIGAGLLLRSPRT